MPTSDEAWDTLVTAYEAAAKEFDAVSDVLLSHVQAKTHPTTVQIDAQVDFPRYSGHARASL
jgi:hypothetical protein